MKIFTNITENIYFGEGLDSVPKNCIVSVGFFDGVHLGHRYVIERLMYEADSLNTEELLITIWPHPRSYFGNSINLITTLQEKIDILKNLGLRNLLILKFDSGLAAKTTSEFINDILVNQINAKGIIMGYNNSFGNKNNKEAGIENTDLEIIMLDKFELAGNINISSSNIRNFLSQGMIKEANELLGYEFILSGSVVRGYQIGRRIGFPTANLGNIDKDKIIPANGVYIVEVCIKGIWFRAMMNIGIRPSFDGKNRTIEFHILDFDGDLYSENILIKFKERIRAEKKFEAVEDLILQLHKDRDITRSYFDNL